MGKFIGIMLLLAIPAIRLHIYAQARTHTKPYLIVRVWALGICVTLQPHSHPGRAQRAAKWYRSLSPQRRQSLFAALPALKGLFHAISVPVLHIHARSASAAQAALWHGILSSLQGSAMALRPRWDIGMNVCFSPTSELRIEGIFCLYLGQIIWAALQFGASYVKRRLLLWKNTRLKAS